MMDDKIYVYKPVKCERMLLKDFSFKTPDGKVHYQTERRNYRRYDTATCNGNQIFDTGYYPNNNTQIVIWFWRNNNDNQCIFGCGDDNNEFRLYYRSSGLFTYRWYMGYGTTQAGSNYVRDSNYEGIDNRTNKLIWKSTTGTTLFDYTGKEQQFRLTRPMWLFANNVPESWSDQSTMPYKGKFSDIQIWENGICMYEFVPVMDMETGEDGLLDIVRNEFRNNIAPNPQNFSANSGFIQDDALDEFGQPRYGDIIIN